MGAVHRQLGQLAEADLVTVTRTGNQKHYQARRDSPIFAELHRLVVKTIGLARSLRKALERQAEAVLGRTINPKVITAAQWRTKRARADSFVARVASQPRVFVIGSDDDLA